MTTCVSQGYWFVFPYRLGWSSLTRITSIIGLEWRKMTLSHDYLLKRNWCCSYWQKTADGDSFRVTECIIDETKQNVLCGDTLPLLINNWENFLITFSKHPMGGFYFSRHSKFELYHTDEIRSITVDALLVCAKLDVSWEMPARCANFIPHKQWSSIELN